ncbi:MAG: hypothetical protein SFU86_04860 [Pirellulaceae bacterium]|nr:hypothetical protein [Pirellulaceae bacterium]
MSLDYPYYEELCRHKHRAAWWWLVGDRLCYLGLLTGLISLPVAGVLVAGWRLGLGEHYLAVAGLVAAMFPVAATVFAVGSVLKRHAYTLAERDGISSAEVHERGAAPQPLDGEPGAPADRQVK